MLSLEEQIIDATTEEGQAALKEFEEQEKRAAAAQNAELSAKYADDPEWILACWWKVSRGLFAMGLSVMASA